MAQEQRNALESGIEIQGYRIGRVLGAGGFGITYEAKEVSIGRRVAIKEYLPGGVAMRGADGIGVHPLGAEDRELWALGLDRFKQEAKVLVSLKHDNIVPVLRFFEANGTAYMVMEFQDGDSLANILRGGVRLEESEILEIALPLLDGLAKVHERGFLHRDIKPGNIYIRADGSPVLLDFGAARHALGQKSKSLTTIISAGYAPFEQYQSDGNQGPWTDIYALGAVMYVAATGRRPIESTTRMSATYKGDPDPLPAAAETAGNRYSPSFLAAIDKAMRISEGDRPQSCGQFRTMLVPDDPTTRLREQAAAPAEKPAPKRWRTAALAAALLVAVVAGGFAASGWLAGWPDWRGDGARREALALAEAKRKATEERRRAEQERRRAEAERKRAEAERRKAAEERRRAEEERARAAAEEKRRREMARRKAEQERREAEARRAEDAKRRAAAKARKKAEEEARQRAEARRQRELAAARLEEERRKAAAEAKRKADEEAKHKLEAEAKRRAAEEARRKAEAEANRKAAEEARKKAEAEAAAKRKAEAERRAAEKTVMRSWFSRRRNRGIVYFAFRAAALTAAARAALDRARALARGNAEAVVVVLSSSDTTEGNGPATLALARRRGAAVRSYFVRRGLASSRVKVRSVKGGEGPGFRRSSITVRLPSSSFETANRGMNKRASLRVGRNMFVGRTAYFSRLSLRQQVTRRIRLSFRPDGGLDARCVAETPEGKKSPCIPTIGEAGTGLWSYRNNRLCFRAAVIGQDARACYRISGTGGRYRAAGNGPLAGPFLLR